MLVSLQAKKNAVVWNLQPSGGLDSPLFILRCFPLKATPESKSRKSSQLGWDVGQ